MVKTNRQFTRGEVASGRAGELRLDEVGGGGEGRGEGEMPGRVVKALEQREKQGNSHLDVKGASGGSHCAFVRLPLMRFARVARMRIFSSAKAISKALP
jgi:hypothetical protein